MSFSIATDITIQDYLSNLTENTSDYEKQAMRTGIVDRLVQYAGYEKYVYSIQIIDGWGNKFEAGELVTASKEKKQFIRDEADKGIGSTRWVFPDSMDSSLIAAREMQSYRYFDFKNMGTLVIRIRMDQIVKDIVAGTEMKEGEM